MSGSLIDTFSRAADTAKPSPKPKPRRKAPPPITFRASEDERAAILRAAGAMSLSAFIRLKVLADLDIDAPRRKVSRKRHTPSAELAVLGQMLGGLGQSRLSQNMNQIAKAANMGALPVSPALEAELFEACAAIQDMRTKLIEALGVKPTSSRCSAVRSESG